VRVMCNVMLVIVLRSRIIYIPASIQAKCAHPCPYANTIETSSVWISNRSQVVRAKQLLVVRHAVDALLGEFECSKENRIDYTGARHGYTKA
jgi:hypothetical protein